MCSLYESTCPTIDPFMHQSKDCPSCLNSYHQNYADNSLKGISPIPWHDTITSYFKTLLHRKSTVPVANIDKSIRCRK